MGGASKPAPAKIHSSPRVISNLKVKRVYDKPAGDDGLRVLVDRLWPRGLTKRAAAIDLWLKDIAPTDDLRRWYGHDPAKWLEFKKRYVTYLRARTEVVNALKEKIKEGTVTLVYSSREVEINNAVALVEFLEDSTM